MGLLNKLPLLNTMPLLMILRVVVGAYFKQLVFTAVAVVTWIIASFYFFGWWGILTSLIGVPLIILTSVGYLIYQFKKNPMMMLKMMAMSTPGVSTAMNIMGDDNLNNLANLMTQGNPLNNRRGQVVEVEAFEKINIVSDGASVQAKKQIVFNKPKVYQGEVREYNSNTVDLLPIGALEAMEQIQKDNDNLQNAKRLAEQAIAEAQRK